MIFHSKRRTTCNTIQRKKHYKQMSIKEKQTCIKLLQDTVKKHKQLKVSEHTEEKLETSINFKALIGMIFGTNNLQYIIEYNQTTKYGRVERRILVRHPQKVKVDGYLSYMYIVIGVDTGRIVTAYYNKVTDVHKTLDLSYYDKNLKIY